MGARVSITKTDNDLIDKILYRIVKAQHDGSKKIIIYFNKPSSKKIKQSSQVIYHSKIKVNLKQIETFMQLYQNDSMVFRWNKGGECLIINFLPTPTPIQSHIVDIKQSTNHNFSSDSMSLSLSQPNYSPIKSLSAF